MNSREIKFRVWHKLTKKWITYRALEDYSSQSIYLDELFYQPSGEIVFQQFTGLKDVNGREIYEGDVVCWDGPHESEWIGTVEYAAPSFEINWFKTPYPVANTRLDSRVRVAGNKFENPELLNS